MEKYIILFVEGYGDEIFFENLVKYLEKDNNLHLWKIENLRAVGQYSQKAFRIYKNRIFKEVENYDRTIYFVYDTDVFQEPPYPVDWSKVEDKFLEFDSSAKIIHIKVNQNLEDWIMEDLEGICKMLKMSITPQIQEHLREFLTGYEKISYLFKRANNIYTKDQNDLKEICKNLDFDKIINRVSPELNNLIKELKI
ncbi:MAG: hypothetical protein ACRCZ9_01995 [Fusobacteriaceae bacterium]